MDNLARRRQLAAEQLYGNEALRGYLDDTAAKQLLEWLQDCLTPIVETTATIDDDEEADEIMYPRLKAMRKLAKQINVLATRGAEMDPEARQRTLAKIQKYAATMYGIESSSRSRALTPGDVTKRLSAQLPELLPHPEQLIAALREELEVMIKR